MSISIDSLPNIYTRSVYNLFRRSPVRVGVALPGFILPYSRASAVARLRVYDVIEMFAENVDVAVELYMPGRKYDVVIFEKAVSSKDLALATSLKKVGVKIVLDLNVDYFSQATPRITDDVHRRAHQLARMADSIITPSKRLADEWQERRIHDYISYIPEPIAERYFAHVKRKFAAVPRLVWCGYSTKAAELETIAGHLQEVQDQYGAEITIISDKDPQLDFGPYFFIHYREQAVPAELIKSDVFVAPRRFDQPYKLHHTFTKIGLPMATGLPVLASPVPSYMASPAVVCETDQDWSQTFESLYSGRLDLVNLSERGREFCQKEFSWDRVRKQYRELINSLLKN